MTTFPQIGAGIISTLIILFSGYLLAKVCARLSTRYLRRIPVGDPRSASYARVPAAVFWLVMLGVIALAANTLW